MSKAVTVKLGAWYRHNETGHLLQVRSASAPGCDNFVKMSEKERVIIGPSRTWEGTWEEFFDQWTEVVRP
jgi:hypothetical protein